MINIAIGLRKSAAKNHPKALRCLYSAMMPAAIAQTIQNKMNIMPPPVGTGRYVDGNGKSSLAQSRLAQMMMIARLSAAIIISPPIRGL